MRIADLLFERRDARDWRLYVFALALAALAGWTGRAFAPAFDPLVIYLIAVSLSVLAAGAFPAAVTAVGVVLVLSHDTAFAPRALAAYALVGAGQIFLITWLKAELAGNRDLTSVTKAELDAQKVRFQELQHRVGNHMQVVASILTLQKTKVRADPSLAVAALEETRERVVNMSRVHRRLYDPAAVGKSVQQHIAELCDDFTASASPHRVVCSVAREAAITDPLKLMTLSLLIGEAVNNALKHAFPDEEGGTISVALECQGRNYIVSVHDTGRGLPPGLDPMQAPGLGFKIMQSLAAQLGGTLEFANADGVTIRAVFAA